MKKFVVFVLLVLMITGCGKKTSGDVKENFITKIEKKNSYLMKGTMNITSNEDVFSYNVTAAKDKENYRVNLVNQINFTPYKNILKTTQKAKARKLMTATS